MPALLADQPVLTAAGGRIALAAALAEAQRRGLAMSVAVTDPAGELLAFERMDGALPVSIAGASQKARTAARTRVATKALQDFVDGGKTSLLAIGEITPAQGGIPLADGGRVIGAIGASGGSLDEDEAVAAAGARALTAALATPDGPAPKPFEIFRGADKRDYGAHGIMGFLDMTPTIAEALTEFAEAGGGKGQQVSMLYARPGFSLTHVWFKSHYPLPLHSHASDCLYYLLAGSIRIGTEQIQPGDGFFVGDSVPYTYETGPEGAEVLEFRATDELNIRFLAKNKTAWSKTVARLRERAGIWAEEAPPSRV